MEGRGGMRREENRDKGRERREERRERRGERGRGEERGGEERVSGIVALEPAAEHMEQLQRAAV